MSITAQTRLSSKGQMVLPSSIRRARNWHVGTELIVEDTPGGVLVNARQPQCAFPLTRFEDIAGTLKYDGPPPTLADMDEAISEAVRERHARGRY